MLKQVKAKPRPEYMVFAPFAIMGFDDAARRVRLNPAPSAVEALGVPAPAPSAFSKAYAETIAKAACTRRTSRSA